MPGERVRAALRAALPASLRRALRSARLVARGREGLGAVDLGDLRRATPVSREFGFDRGRCVDRRFIERFLEEHRADVRGRCLEVGDDSYTRRFGGEHVTRADVLHVTGEASGTTLVGDLTTGAGLPERAFDCAIITQTLSCVYDVHAAIRTLHRALVPGGVLLASVPGISQVSRFDADRWGDFWRFTPAAARRLAEEAFPADRVDVRGWGNVLAAVALLHGLSADELDPTALDLPDPDYPVVVTIRAARAP